MESGRSAAPLLVNTDPLRGTASTAYCFSIWLTRGMTCTGGLDHHLPSCNSCPADRRTGGGTGTLLYLKNEDERLASGREGAPALVPPSARFHDTRHENVVVIFYSSGDWDESDSYCVGRRTTHPPLKMHFLCCLAKYRPVVVNCPCCSLFCSQRPTCTGPRLSGLVRSPRHDSRELHLCCCHVLNCPFCSQPVPGCREPPVPGPFRGTFPRAAWCVFC